MIAFVLLILGLAGLALGGEFLVRGAVSVARALRISPMVIGLTLVGFGTSTPELATSLQAALSGSSGIAIGNVIGSNICNILLILGFTALFTPIGVNADAFKRDGTAVLIATLLCVATVITGDIERWTGIVFVFLLASYLAFTLVQERRVTHSAAAEIYEEEVNAVAETNYAIWMSVGMTVGGLVITIVGARLLVDGAVSIAQALGVSETVIGLTVVSIGTSMPELVTSIIAVRKQQGDVALGNVLGSNLFNILGILGITAVVQPMVVPSELIHLDIWVMSSSTLLLIVFARSDWRIGRREGGLMFACYLAYLSWLLR